MFIILICSLFLSFVWQLHLCENKLYMLAYVYEVKSANSDVGY